MAWIYCPVAIRVSVQNPTLTLTGRVIDRAYAESVATALTGQPGQVIAIWAQAGESSAALAILLPELQKLAAKLKDSLPGEPSIWPSHSMKSTNC